MTLETVGVVLSGGGCGTREAVPTPWMLAPDRVRVRIDEAAEGIATAVRAVVPRAGGER